LVSTIRSTEITQLLTAAKLYPFSFYRLFLYTTVLKCYLSGCDHYNADRSRGLSLCLDTAQGRALHFYGAKYQLFGIKLSALGRQRRKHSQGVRQFRSCIICFHSTPSRGINDYRMVWGPQGRIPPTPFLFQPVFEATEDERLAGTHGPCSGPCTPTYKLGA
jgi:hypothetical protein